MRIHGLDKWWPGNISFVGYYDFVPDHNGNKIFYLADQYIPVGNMMVSDIDNDGKWEVIIDNKDRTDLLFTNAYLYVGSLAGYLSSGYEDFPYHIILDVPSSTVTFQLPF